MKEKLHGSLLVALVCVMPIWQAGAEVSTHTYGGHTYKLHHHADCGTFAQAMAAAAAAKGYLARIDRAAENADLYAWVASVEGLTQTAPDGGGARYVWLGGTDQAVEGTWKWLNNGNTFYIGQGGSGGSAQNGLYTNWGAGDAVQEPDDYAGQDGLGMALDAWPFPGIGGDAAEWNDIATSNRLPFIVEIEGEAMPEIVVEHPAGASLVDGMAKKSFGTVAVGATGSAKTFTIRNTGTAKLSGLAITKNGAQAGNFIVSPLAKTWLAPGTSTTFKVRFKPTAAGTRNAAIHIKSNDADENPFDIKLTGAGVIPQ